MQHKSMKRPHDPRQLVDKLCKHFVRALQRAEAKGSLVIPFKAATVVIPKKLDQDSGTGRPSVYPLHNREEKINERINKLAQVSVNSPSKTTQKLTDLNTNGIIINQDNSDNAESEK